MPLPLARFLVASVVRGGKQPPWGKWARKKNKKKTAVWVVVGLGSDLDLFDPLGPSTPPPTLTGYAGVSYDTSSSSRLETEAERLIRELRSKRMGRDATPGGLEDDLASPGAVARGLKAYTTNGSTRGPDSGKR